MKTILLSQGYVALIDNKDFPLVENICWHIKKHGQTFYAKHSSNAGPIYMHRIILKATKGQEIDHIDGNGLNNKRKNLRIVTHRQNMKNIHVPKTSKYTGVYWNPAAKKWQAYIWLNNKSKYLGVYSTQESAYGARLAFEKSLIQ